MPCNSSIVADSTTVTNASTNPIGLNLCSRGHLSSTPGSCCLGPRSRPAIVAATQNRAVATETRAIHHIN
eukprot:2641013-Lingulodinium_polyedra.AAC.1